MKSKSRRGMLCCCYEKREQNDNIYGAWNECRGESSVPFLGSRQGKMEMPESLQPVPHKLTSVCVCLRTCELTGEMNRRDVRITKASSKGQKPENNSRHCKLSTLLYSFICLKAQRWGEKGKERGKREKERERTRERIF